MIRGTAFLMAAFLLLAVTTFLITELSGCGGNKSVVLVISGLANGNLIPFRSKAGQTQGKMVGGLPHRVALIDGLKASGRIPADSIHLDLGDNISGTPEAYYTRGKSIIDLLNPSGLDAMLLGNREFDFGLDILKLRRSESKFRYIASNVFVTGTEAPPDFIDNHFIIERGGTKIGVLGFIPSNTPEVTSEKNIRGLSFVEASTVAGKIVDSLKSSGASVVVAISQNNLSRDRKEVIESLCVKGLDLLCLVKLEYEPRPATLVSNTWTVAMTRKNKGSEILIVRMNLGPGDKVTGVSCEAVDVLSDDLTPRPELARTVSEVSRKIDNMMDEVIGESVAPLIAEYNSESNLGNLVCDAMRSYAGTQVAFQNSGGLQANIKAGGITLRDLYKALPFDNEVVAMTLSGAELKDILGNSATRTYGVLQTSGLSYSFVGPTAPGGSRLVSAQVEGKPIDDSATYTVATNSFLAGGGDRYKAFTHGKEIRIMDPLREVIKDFLKKASKVNPVIENRIVEQEAVNVTDGN